MHVKTKFLVNIFDYGKQVFHENKYITTEGDASIAIFFFNFLDFS